MKVIDLKSEILTFQKVGSFGNEYYVNISNGRKMTRIWLLHSISKDSVFCLYFKLFGGRKQCIKEWQVFHVFQVNMKEEKCTLNNNIKCSEL